MMSYTSESAETLALQALAWLAGDDDLMATFLGSTGASKDELRAQAKEPAFLGAVLDFIMMDDTWVVAFSDSVSVPYERLMMARSALPGGEQVHWT